MPAGAPKVSIVMPAYNHAPYVARGIRSVLDQSYANVELVVVDDGSTDSTWDEIERVRASVPGRFTAIRQENAGICRALNRGISHCVGEFVGVIASDDYFLPTKIERQMTSFRSADHNVALLHTSAYLDYQNGRGLEDITGSYAPAEGNCFDQILTQEVRIIAPSILFRRTAYDAVGGFDEGLAAEDVDFFIRLAAAGYEFAYIPEPLLVKTVVDRSAGADLRGLIVVHEKILEKQRHRLSAQRYEEIRAAMYDHLIILSASGGNYRLGGATALRLSRERRSLTPLLQYVYWTSRGTLLRALPRGARHTLRLARASARRELGGRTP